MATDTESPATPPALTTASRPAGQEQLVDEREATAGARESTGGPRQRFLDARENCADRISRLTGTTVPVRQKRPFEAISRARALLASSRARLDRTEATLSHTKSGDARERRSVEQEIAASVRRAFGDERPPRPCRTGAPGRPADPRGRAAEGRGAEHRSAEGHGPDDRSAEGHGPDDRSAEGRRAGRAAGPRAGRGRVRERPPSRAPPSVRSSHQTIDPSLPPGYNL